VGFDLAYNFNDALQNAYICFNDTPPVGVSLPVVNNAAPCAADPFNPLQTDSYYINNTHFGSGSLMLRPAKRVTAQLGYSLTRVDGKTPQFNFLQPLGTLAYNYQQPIANVSVELARGFSWNGGYNYHQYNESFESGPTAQRYFHANQATFGLHYAF
jgi:hypothetical protein